MRDELRDRLARIDPDLSQGGNRAAQEPPQELLEIIMSTPTTETAPRNLKGRWLAVAAVAAAFVAVIGLSGTLDGSDPTTLALTAGADDPMASCIVFSPEELERVGEIAFGGTVVSVEGETITLDADVWFRGEEFDQVTLTAQQGMEALIGGVPFEVGERYLISAQAGTVNYCGFSGPATPDYENAFETAFATG